LVETMGAYLLARCHIRSADDFLAMARTLFKFILFFLPLAVAEAVSHRNVAIEMFALVFPTMAAADEGMRMGLHRVQSVFEHPILFCMFGATCFSFTYAVIGYKESIFLKIIKTSAVVFSTFLSLSSAPMAALALQASLLTWDTALKSFQQRWYLLI